MHQAVRHVCLALMTILAGGLLGATLVRLAPGFGVDEQELDARLTQDSLQRLRDSRAGERDIIGYYFRYLSAGIRGDLGMSRTLNRPVAELLAERLPVTLDSVVVGTGVGWFLGMALAAPVAFWRTPAYEVLSTGLGGILLCVPPAVLALLFLFAGAPSRFAIALVVFPRVFRYSRNLLLEASRPPHVLTAAAKGLSRARTFLWHVAPLAAPQMLALAGASVSMAFGAAIPIEVICDSPGVGQLAWQAALGRDLPLLVNLTVLVTAVTLVANSAADLAISMCGAPSR